MADDGTAEGQVRRGGDGLTARSWEKCINTDVGGGVKGGGFGQRRLA